MTWRNRVIWSEGMFLRPHHFQQHDRYLENLLESRCAPMKAYSWGITDFKIDNDLLSQGKIALSVCQGILPDGTPFEGIRFIDRFEVRQGRLSRQDVWNDIAEVRA